MERKEPTISGSIKPEKDEVAARQPRSSQASKATAGGKTGGGSAPPPRGPRPPVAIGGGGGLVWAALLLALMGLGASGFLGWQWLETQRQLQQSGERISDLERRLDITSDQSSEYVDEIQAKLEWADSEIRKLWGVSYDTNRGRIADNQKSIETLKQSLNSVKQTADSADSRSQELRQALAQSRAQLQQLSPSLEGLGDLRETLATQDKRWQNLSEKLDRVSRDLNQLEGLAERVANNEEAIAAIDSYRRSVNRDLLNIKDQLSQLQQ